MAETNSISAVDISRDRLLLQIQSKLLEVAASSASIHDALNAVVLAAKELLGDACKAAIFITNPAANNLKFVAAVGLSEEYTAAIDNFAIGAHQPSCGRAAFIGNDVIVKDVATDPYWAPYLSLAEKYGIEACWSFLLRNQDGQAIGTFAIYHDEPAEPDTSDFEVAKFFSNIASLLISRHKNLEEKAKTRLVTERLLVSANQNLIHAQAITAHELRNPLQAIGMSLSLLELADENVKRKANAIQALRRQFTVMNDLVNEMADANSTATGKHRLNKTRLLLQDLIYNVVDSMRPNYAEKGQSLTVDIPTLPIYIEVDSSRLTQIISNLLTNANKFTGKDGHVNISAIADETTVRIHVKDDGVGLAPENLETVFDIYSRVHDDAQQSQPGHGIGLNVVRELAELHGGTVEVMSSGLGKGSCFSISLPIRDAHAIH